jgi:putative transcriptional regulator
MDSSLRERFARLGPIRAVDRVSSGSPGVFVLRPRSESTAVRTVDAALTLARRGLPLLRAKRAMEELLAEGSSFVELPTVDDPPAVVAELHASGIAAAQTEPRPAPDVRLLRRRLGLTRAQFAARYGLDVETLRNWEAGRREPDRTARSYLLAIANDPKHVERAYAPTPA